MSVGRRGFLRLLAAAPVAAPVVAREAAQKAGVGSIGLGVGEEFPPSAGQNWGVPTDENDWVRSRMKQVLSKAWEDEERESMRDWHPSRLDPDLAASRSLSLSAALRIQRDRNIENRINRARDDAKRNYLRVFGLEFVG